MGLGGRWREGEQLTGLGLGGPLARDSMPPDSMVVRISCTASVL